MKGKMFEDILEMYKKIDDFDNVLRVQRRLGMGNDASMLLEHAEVRLVAVLYCVSTQIHFSKSLYHSITLMLLQCFL